MIIKKQRSNFPRCRPETYASAQRVHLLALLRDLLAFQQTLKQSLWQPSLKWQQFRPHERNSNSGRKDEKTLWTGSGHVGVSEVYAWINTLTSIKTYYSAHKNSNNSRHVLRHDLQTSYLSVREGTKLQQVQSSSGCDARKQPAEEERQQVEQLIFFGATMQNTNVMIT